MNVKKLKELLNQYPDDMEIVVNRYSDYQFLDDDCLSVTSLVDHGFYLMRSHPSMSEDNKAREKQCLYLST